MNAMSEVTSPQIDVTIVVVGDKVDIAVKDNGPGITVEHLKVIFDPFFTTRKKGLGLGLSISYRIMKAMGGELYASNHPEGGAIFTLTLPLYPSSSTSSENNE
jgi:C4-dicarboxylate-specific signal transduction histidine kinase